MGRKSSAKTQAQGASPQRPPEAPRGRFSPLAIFAVAAVVAVVGLFAYSRSGSENAAAPQQPPSAQASTPSGPPPTAKFGPHKQDDLPPLPLNPEPPARPAAVVTAAYKFAAEHPEVLSYVPCYCGCERSFGHRGNDDCFVAARAANGDVTEWEPHGMT
jgi:Protein of unknown function with PCYCGC motif